MKPRGSIVTIVMVILASACGGSNQTAPSPIPDPPTGRYTVTGTVTDGNGRGLPDMEVRITDRIAASTSTTTDARGTYRFDNVLAGYIGLAVLKDRAMLKLAPATLLSDSVFDFRIGPGRLVIGEVFRGIVDEPPYDPVGWDARAPSRWLQVVAPATGTLEIVLTWSGPSTMDLLIPGITYFEAERRTVSGSLLVTGGVTYDLIVNSYYGRETFELRADLRVP